MAEFFRRRRGLAFALPAAAMAVLVIVAALNFEEGTPPSKRDMRLRDAQGLLAPRAATAEELADASGSLSEQTAIRLTEGAWVQVADETGRLAQQYSAARLEPLAGSRLRMTEPRARIYLRDGRVMTLVARDGLVSVPKRALESGTLEGDVEIRLFKPDAGRPVDVLRDVPSIVVHADEAQFDGVAGEVRCDRAVRIATDAGSFAGEGMTLVLDASGEGVETLLVDRALEPIRIDRATRAIAEKRRERRAGGGTAGAASGGMVVRAPGDSAEDPTAPGATAPGATKPGAANPGATNPGGRKPGATSVAGASPVDASRPPTPESERGRFYRLTLHGGVEIVRTRAGHVSTIRGDELIAIFSLESQGLDQLAFVPAAVDPFHESRVAMNRFRFASPPAMAVGALLFAVPQDSSAESPAVPASGDSDSVVVSFGGRLEMVPVTDPSEELASSDDIRFDVLGSRVELVDGKSRTRVNCARLRYSVLDERVEAEGRDALPLTVVNARMSLEGRRFSASFRDGVGRLDGAGRMAFAPGAGREVAWLGVTPSLAPDAARMLVSADPAAVALLQSVPPQPVDPASIRFDPADQELEILWKGGVDLRFAGGGDDARLSGARFEGGVDVLGRQFELGSSTLEVAFSPDNAERIDAIVADGGTRVKQLGGSGAMRAERLELFLGSDRRGESVPRKLVARRDVEARDDRQTIWTEDLVVTFAERRATGDAGVEGARPEAGAKPPVVANAASTAGPDLGMVDIEFVEAKGGVQVMLAEGARVFADELTGNALERKLRLRGDDVAIVRGNVIADGLRDLRFDDAARSARSEGPGRFRAFRKAIPMEAGRIERPDPQGQAALDASWTGQLAFQDTEDARGALDLRGDVRVRSRPSGSVSDAVDANSVLLDFGPPATATRSGAAGSGERAVEHFLARGDARVESRAWTDENREGEPRVFRLTGDHIEYDLRSREGLVVGVGGLLVNVPPGADAGTPVKTAGGATPISFASEGATRFSWKQKMELVREIDDRFVIRMDDGVEVLHAGARDQDRMSMRCDALEARVRRPDASGTTENSGVDLGGPAELLGVKGTGGVFIRTPGQDLECGEFDYSVQSGIAMLRAAEGRAVTVVFANQPTPLQATEIAWDMRAGTLEIRKPLVTGGR